MENNSHVTLNIVDIVKSKYSWMRNNIYTLKN